jgi:hypothetical protein
MKKIYTILFLFVFVAASVLAQQSNPVNQPASKSFNKSFREFKAHRDAMYKSASSVNTERWYNFGDAMDLFHQTYFGDSSQLYANYLFPDSTILVDYGASGYGGTWIHMLGDVLDVKSGYFNDAVLYPDPNELFLTAGDDYYLDSLDFYFIYSRNITSVVDSLIFEIAVNSPVTTGYFLAPVATNLATDSVFIKNIPYAYASNTLNLAGKRRFAFALDDILYADSLANGFHHIAFPATGVPMIQAGKFVVVGVQFKPGYTWTANTDTIANMNSVRFLSYLEAPNGAFPQYTKHDYNISYIVPQSVRYNVDAVGWNGRFIPSYAYMGGTTNTYSYNHHVLYYKVNTQPVGVNDIVGNAAIITDIYPNPVTGISTFDYQLTSKVNVEITVTDVTGRVVQTNNIGMQNAGVHKAQIDGSFLSEGLYLYTIKAGDSVVSKSMSVTK